MGLLFDAESCTYDCCARIGGGFAGFHRRGSSEIYEAYKLSGGLGGHLWQGRFASFPMDERYLLAAARYVELNPVRAMIEREPWEYPWSSARAHISGVDDGLVKVTPLLEMVKDWKEFLLSGLCEEELEELRRHERSGRPLGSEAFVKELETETGRILHKQRPGRKRKDRQNLVLSRQQSP